MNTSNKFLTALILTLAFAGLTAASAAEMTITPKESSTRIDSFTSYEIMLENAGPEEDVYDISSNSPREVTVAPRRAPEEGNLAPGESTTVNVWYNPEINAEEGEHSFTVTASSRRTGEEYSITGLANVIKEHKVDVTVDSASKTGCRGETVTYNLEVTNTGIQAEEFSLSTGYGELSQETLNLQDGETRQVTLTASSDEEVQENFNVVAAGTSYAQDIENLQFSAETCYQSDVSITPQQQDVAAKTEAEFNVTVRNTGTRQDTFALSSNIGNLEGSEATIEGASSGTTTLTVTPEELGEQEIEVTAQSQVTSSDSATMNVYNGMDVAVRPSGNARVCEDENTTMTFDVENTGEAAEIYSLESNRGNLSEGQISLDPGNSEQVEVSLNGADLDTGSYPVEVTATAQSFGEPSSSGNSTFTVENCWDLDMEVMPEVASAGENMSTIYEIELNNTGARENTYELSHEGPEWVSIRPEQVTVAAGERRTAYMYAGVPFEKEGRVEITAEAVGNQVTKSQNVTLVIGEEVEEAIESEEGNNNTITGNFGRTVSEITEEIASADNLAKVAASVVVGAAITAGVLLFS